MSDELEKVFKNHPLKVIRLSWLIATAMISIFAIMVSGYFFWDNKLKDIQNDVEKQIIMIKDTTNAMNTNVNVIDTKIGYIQRQMDQINQSLNDFLVSKNYRASVKDKIQSNSYVGGEN